MENKIQLEINFNNNEFFGKQQEFSKVLAKPKLRLDAKAFNRTEYQQEMTEKAKLQQKQVKRKPIVLDETLLRYQGTVKYFDEQKIYGFLVLDLDGSEVFFHMDDIKSPKLTKEFIMTYKKGNLIRFSFNVMKYIGKYKESLKATEMKLIQ